MSSDSSKPLEVEEPCDGASSAQSPETAVADESSDDSSSKQPLRQAAAAAGEPSAAHYGTFDSDFIYDATTGNVPAYTETDEGDLEARIERAQADPLVPLVLPLTAAPASPWAENRDYTEEQRAAAWHRYRVASSLVRAFYDAIGAKRDDLVESFVRRGLVSPDVPDSLRGGDRPLLAAVRAGNAAMILTLARLGASVEASGGEPARTPLQLAAQLGNLAAVRVLMEDLGADDAVVAPDGAIALRLAAEGGHREVVDYLPARRGGGWQRWRTAHAREMRAVRDAVHGVYTLFRYLLWEFPRLLVYTVPKELWKKRYHYARWWKKQILELPGRIKGAAKSVVKGIKQMPELTRRAGKAIVRSIKKIPAIAKKTGIAIAEASKVVASWLVDGVKRTVDAIAFVFNRVVSLLHTAAVAIINFFKTVTLKDVWDGMCAVFRAVFVDLPGAVWSFVLRFGEVSCKVLETLFGGLGLLIWLIGYGIFLLVRYIPQQIFRILVSIARLIGRGFHELLVWYDPKRV